MSEKTLSLKELTHKIDEMLCDELSRYHKHQNEFDQFRGRTLTRQEAEQLEKIYTAIKTSMTNMIDILTFITVRYEVAREELHAYKVFIDQLKEAQCLKEKQ